MSTNFTVIPKTATENLASLQGEALEVQQDVQAKAAAFREAREALDVKVNRYNSYVEGVADTLEVSLDAYRLDLQAGRFVELTDEEKAAVAQQKAQAQAAAEAQAEAQGQGTPPVPAATTGVVPGPAASGRAAAVTARHGGAEDAVVVEEVEDKPKPAPKKRAPRKKAAKKAA